jgi:hypothetical protein
MSRISFACPNLSREEFSRNDFFERMKEHARMSTSISLTDAITESIQLITEISSVAPRAKAHIRRFVPILLSLHCYARKSEEEDEEDEEDEEVPPDSQTSEAIGSSFLDTLNEKKAELTRKEIALTKKETELTDRERGLVKREAELAKKEAELVKREAELAKKSAESEKVSEYLAWRIAENKAFSEYLAGKAAENRSRSDSLDRKEECWQVETGKKDEI